MFYRRGFFFRGFMLLLLFFGLFSVIRGSSYRTAWSDGYTAGLQAGAAAVAGDGAAAPAAPVREYPHVGWGFSPGLWLLGACFTFFLVIGPLFFLLRLLFFRRRGPWGHERQWAHGPRKHGPWGHGPWGHGPHGAHHHSPAHEKQPEDVEPDIRSA